MRIYIFIIVFSFHVFPAVAATYYSRQSGLWNDPNTWSTVACGGVAAAAFPGAADDAVICAANTVTLDANRTIDQLVVNTSGILNLGGFNLTVSNSPSSVASGGSMIGSGTLIVGGILDVFTNDGTITISNITVNALINIFDNNITGIVTLTGNFTIASISAVTNGGTMTVDGNLNGSGAAASFINQANASVTVRGACMTTGILTASANPNNVTLDGAAAQSVKNTTYHNLYLSTSGTKTSLGNITINNLLTVTGSVVFDATNNNLNGVGGLTMTGTSEIRIAKTGVTVPELTGAYSLASGTTIRLNAAGAQTARGVNYAHLILDNSNVGCDLSSVTTVNGNLTIQNIATMSTCGIMTVGGTLIYSSSGTSMQTNPITIGAFSQSSGTYNANGYNMAVNSGNWNRTGGTFLAGTGSVSFTSAVPQSIGGTVSTAFSNLTINNTSSTGVTLGQPATVTTALTLTDGYIYCDAVNLLTLNDNATSSTGSVASFVDGPMRKTGDDAFIFPTGDDVLPMGAGVEDVWARIGISAQASATQEFTATYFASSYSDLTVDLTIVNLGGDEYWTLDRGVTANNVNVTLYWEDASRSGIIDNSSPDLVVARYNGVDFTSNGQSAISGTDPGWVTSTTVSSFNTPFTFGSTGGSNPLPVVFLSFDARPAGNSVDISWITASEFNSDYFVVQRSKDGSAGWEDVAQVNAAGNSSAVKNYSSVDDEPYKDVSYYRLKQVDYDGKFVFSTVVAVSFRNEDMLEVYPNPSPKDALFNIRITDKKGVNVLITVRDLFNKIYYSEVVVLSNDQEVIPIDPPGQFAAGVYLVEVVSDNAIYERKILIE